jgi:pimeloyl-ACP methyl ester carboxylesterase
MSACERTLDTIEFRKSWHPTCKALCEGVRAGDPEMAATAPDSTWQTARTIPPLSSRPVVLLHGFASTPRVLALLARHVRAHLERPVLRPSLGFGWGDVSRAAERVDAAITAAGFDEVDVVGHSLGGLVATELLKNVDRGRRVRRVITLGTPHAGVPLARWAAIATLSMSPCMRQLVPGSRYLARLAARPVPAGSELVAITGEADALVPERSSCIATRAGQRWLRLRDVGHMQLVFHRDVLALVGDLLGVADAAASPSRAPLRARRRTLSRGRFSIRRALPPPVHEVCSVVRTDGAP